MTKFLKDGKKLTKQNFAGTLAEYRLAVKGEIDKTGKTEYQILMEQREKTEDQEKYNNAMKVMFAALSEDAKKKVFSKLDEKSQKAISKRTAGNIRTELEFNKSIKPEMFINHLKKQVGEAKTMDESLEIVRPFLSEDDIARINRMPTKESIFVMLGNKGEDFIKARYLNLVAGADSIDKARELAKPFLSEEVLADKKFSYEITPVYLDYVADELFVIAAEDLSEEAIEDVAEKIESFKSLSKKDWEEVGTHYLAKDTASVQELIEKDKTISQEDKTKYIELMKKISDNTIETDTKHINAVDYERKALETALSRDAEKVGKEELKKDGIEGETLKGENGYDVVIEGKENDFQKLKTKEIEFSDDTKNKMKAIFAKLEEYGYVSNEPLQEEGVKAYGFSAYQNAINKYSEALGKHDVKESVKWAQEVDKHERQLSELLNMVNESFPSNDTDMYPGNVDVLRNKSLPVAMRKDIKGASKLNALYAIHTFIKTRNLDVDEFLNKPVSNVQEYYKKDVSDLVNSTKIIEGKSGAEAIRAFTHVPRTDHIYVGYGVPRVVEGLASLETDPELKVKNYAAFGAFKDAFVKTYSSLVGSRKEFIQQNENSLDRFFIVREPQVDDKLISGSMYNAEIGKMDSYGGKGFDEVEYIAKSGETPEQFIQRIKDGVVSYMEMNESTGDGDYAISNKWIVRSAQKAAAKYLIVNGAQLKDALKKADASRTAEEKALVSLSSFVNDGKTSVDRWISEKYPFEEEMEAQLIGSYECDNPYKDMSQEFNARFDAQKSRKGSSVAYENAEKAQATVEEKKAYLTKSFREGTVPESFYEARMAQLNKGEVDAQMPPFFPSDNLPKRDDYIKATYGEESFNDLSKEEKNLIYNNYVERMQEEKRTFLAKQYMLEKHMVRKGQFFTMKEMDDMYPTANNEAKEAEQAYKDQVAAEKQAEQDRLAKEAQEKAQKEQEAAERERNLPHDKRIKFVREGETVTKENFAAMYSRFHEYTLREVKKGENESELSLARRAEEKQGDKLRTDSIFENLRETLTPEQKTALINVASAKSRREVNYIIFQRLIKLTDRKYYGNDDEIKMLEDGPEKERIENEQKVLNDLRFKMNKHKITLEEAIEKCKPFVKNPNDLNGDYLRPENCLINAFFENSYKEIGQELSKILTEEQLKKIASDVDNYKVPWERTMDEMGAKVYTEQTEKAKKAIDEMDISDEEKAQMKADMDAANDFLREPIGEDPNSAYFQVTTNFQNGSLRDGDVAGAAKLAEEGFDTDCTEQRLAEGDEKNVVTVVKEGKQEEADKLNKAEFKFSPETKQSIKEVFKMMRESGLGGAGIIGENGISKQYGLTKVADSITAYKKAIQEGDPKKIAAASKAMITEKNNADKIMDYIREHFPVDRHSENFAMAGNIDVTRNSLFPPKYRYDATAVSQFNSIYIMMNFAEANGIEPDEFLERPAHYMREFYFDKESTNVNDTIRGKSGAEALFEATRNADKIPVSGGYGSGRAFEALYYLDKDPAIRAHNHGLGQYLEKTVALTSGFEKITRNVIYADGGKHLDRLLFVSEPMQDASILGIPLYNAKNLSYDDVKEFNEMEYLRNNGKSVAEMKEMLDNNIKRFLLISKENPIEAVIKQNTFLEIAQKAASKILLAKHMEKDTVEYQALRGLLTNGQEYVSGLVQEEKDKLRDAEEKLKQAQAKKSTLTDKAEIEKTDKEIAEYQKILAYKKGLNAADEKLKKAKNEQKDLQNKIRERRAALIADGKDPVLDDTYAEYVDQLKTNDKRISRLQEEVRKNGNFERMNVNMGETSVQQKYEKQLQRNLSDLERTVAELGKTGGEYPKDVNLKPDKKFNDSMRDRSKAINGVDMLIDMRKQQLETQVPKGDPEKDNSLQLLMIDRNERVAEMESKKEAYFKSLDEDVKNGRIPKEFMEARKAQINGDPDFFYKRLPDLFPAKEVMSKEDYIKSLTDKGENLQGYDEADKDALYEVYVALEEAKRTEEIETFAMRLKADSLGFENSEKPQEKVEEVQKPEVAEEKEPEKEEKLDFTGRWFQPGSEPSREKFVSQLESIEAKRHIEPEGKNWLERSQAHEATVNEVQRLKYFYALAWEKLSDNGKENVFKALSDENKRSAERLALVHIRELLDKKGDQEKEVSKAIKKAFRENKLSFEQMKAMAEPFLTEEEKKDPLNVPHNHLESYDMSIRDEPKIWQPIVNDLSDKDFKEFAYKTESFVAPLEHTFEEARVDRNGEAIDKVKGLIKKMKYLDGEELTEERRAEVEKDLNEVQKITSTLDKEYAKALDGKRSGREEGVYGMNHERSKTALEVLKAEGIDVGIEEGDEGNIVFNGIQKEETDFVSGGEKYTMEQVQPENSEQFEKMNERKFQMRDETKNAIKAIFAKFDEYGMDSKEFNPEEGSKIYGTHRYVDLLNEFIEKSSDNDVLANVQVPGLAKKMLVEFNHVQEIIGMAREAFNLDKGGFYSGNMDVLREDLMPPEWRNDVSGISAYNGLYVMYRTLKEQNVDLDVFLNDPRAYLNEQTDKLFDKTDINKTIQGKSGAEAIMDLCTPYAEIDKSAALRMGRAVETLAKLEADPEMARQNMATEYSYALTGQFKLAQATYRDEVLRVASEHLDRYMFVKEAQEDASLVGFPTYDKKTMRAIQPKEFDEVKYLMNANESPEKFLERISVEGGKLLAMIKERNDRNPEKPFPLGMSKAVNMMQKAAIKYIAVHPEISKSNAAFKKLNELAENAVETAEELIDEQVEKGTVPEIVQTINFEKLEAYGTERTFGEFMKSAEVKNFGAATRTADEQANRNFKNLKNALTRAQNNLNRANNDAARQQAQQQVEEAQKAYDQAIANRKAQLVKDFKDGKITEGYLERRTAQLDEGRINEKLPAMFEADKPMSKNDYIRKTYGQDANLFSNAEKQGLYNTYLNNCKREKAEFLAKKYLESEGLIDKKAPMTKAEKQQEIQKQNEKQVQNVQNDKNGVEKANEKAEEKVEEKVEKVEENVEENAEEKAVENEELGERISIDVEDQQIDLNEDILAFGEQKNLEKGEMQKD